MINPFKKTYTSKEMGHFRFLSKVKLFEKLSDAEMAVFIPFLFLRKYKLDEAVFFRNDPSHALYIVKAGKISLNIDIKDKFEVLTTVNPTGAFGDNVLLKNTRRVYSAVTASDDAELYVIPQVNIHGIFEENVHIKAKMLHSLSEIYNNYTENLFRAYKSSFGFFNLGEAYLNKEGVRF